MGLFKSSTLMGVFTQLFLPNTPTSSKAPMHMIASNTCGPLRPLDPWVLYPNINEIDQSSEHPLLPIVEDISSSVVLSVPFDFGQKLHHNLDYDQVLFTTWATPLLVPHESLDDDPPWLVNLEVMNLSTDNHWDSTAELSNELSNSLPPIYEHLVPHLCLDPPLCPQVDFKSMTMLEFPSHGQPFQIG